MDFELAGHKFERPPDVYQQADHEDQCPILILIILGGVIFLSKFQIVFSTFDLKYVDGHYSILVFDSTTRLGGAQVHRDHKGCHGLETLEYSAAKRQTEEWCQLLQCRFGQRKSRHPTGWFDVKTPKYI